MSSTATMNQSPPSNGRGYLWLGLLLGLISIPVAIAQFSVLKVMFVPWHVPILTTLGALMLVLALGRRRTIVRFVLLGLLLAVAAGQWYIIAVHSKLPAYDGPVVVGKPLPAFQTTLANGRAFTEKDLQDGKPSILVFVRGRWCPVCMIEVGRLEKAHEEFEKRKARVVLISMEDRELASETQSDAPHLVVVADKDRALSNALAVIHKHSGPEGIDTSAPTTILLDGTGTVRWIHRPDNVFTRLTPTQILEAFDANVKGN